MALYKLKLPLPLPLPLALALPLPIANCHYDYDYHLESKRGQWSSRILNFPHTMAKKSETRYNSEGQET